MNDNDLIEVWLRWFMAGDASEGTATVRRSYLRRFSVYAGSLRLATEGDVIGFLDNPRWATETRRAALASLRGFYSWAVRAGHVDVDPTQWLHSIRAASRIPKPIPEHLLADALAAADREQARMLMLGGWAGLRRSEIARVHSDDISDVVLTIKGKGRKVRTVPIHPRLRPYLSDIDGWAFPSPRRFGEPVGPTYVRDRLAEVLPEPWTPHSLRHRFATQAFKGCRDIVAVQQLLGHSKVETTLLYVLVEQDSLTSAVLGVA